MSARMPFMPVSRPPSRVASQEEAQTAVNPPFTVDPNNPLNVSSVPKTQVEATSQPDTTKNVSLGDEARPLNTSSLLKGRNSTQQGQNQNSIRRPFQFAPEKAPLRPGTADPRSKPDQEPNRSSFLNIISPIPRQAPRPSSPSLSINSASGIFTTNAPQPMFRTPTIPALTPNDNQIKNDAHISDSTLGFSFSNPNVPPEIQKSQLPSPPDSLRSKGARNLAPADPGMPPPPFALNFSNPNQTGPQRVLLSSDGTRGPPADHPSVPDNMQLTLNRASPLLLKRSHPDSELDSEHRKDSNDFKRYRKEDDGYNQRAKSITSHLSSPDTVSVHSLTQRHTPDHLTHSTYEHSHQPMSPMDGNGNYSMTNNSGGLTQLLGCEVDAYVEEYAEQYERAVERWKNCSMEEWIAGAEGEESYDVCPFSYFRPTDIQRVHNASSKMKLFASFDAKVDGHKNVLAEREKALEGVKTRLVQESAHVLGHAR
ncbi:hypothetical protein C0995_014061 [Termitomyces sp. Mi166|nr:hypothetical protein C0995_014061 [Termitomyces sp. Mi166\